mmetsp:Transcript_31256/g.78979  ORF Transcript_31256/g.78979 Transcript_31256/m.78979 type:complete len:200 (-) Transcript_31256:243-842(-)
MNGVAAAPRLLAARRCRSLSQHRPASAVQRRLPARAGSPSLAAACRSSSHHSRSQRHRSLAAPSSSARSRRQPATAAHSSASCSPPPGRTHTAGCSVAVGAVLPGRASSIICRSAWLGCSRGDTRCRVMGLTALRCSHAAMADRSYVKPSEHTTGSTMGWRGRRGGAEMLVKARHDKTGTARNAPKAAYLLAQSLPARL